MPPKRKQIDDSTPAEATTSTRSTRAAARSGGKNNTADSATAVAKETSRKGSGKDAGASASAADDAMEVDTAPAAKKARTTAAATKKKTPAGRGRKAKDDDAPVEQGKPTPKHELPAIKVTRSDPAPTPPASAVLEPSPAAAPPAPAPKPNPPPKKPGKAEPYTAQRALGLFSAYADPDDAGVIGPEGFERLCTDADMPLDGSRPIIFAWQMGAKEMAKISKEEWVRGTTSLRVSSLQAISLAISELEDLVVKGKPPGKPPTKKDEDYNRSVYMGYAADPKAAFQKLYQFSFALVKPEQSKNIDMDTSVAFWTVLLVPKYPLMGEVLGFIGEKPGTYKATNKDLWSMMLEFCETVEPDLSNYEADGAWPTLLDDFVAWKGAQNGIGNGKADGDD